MHQKLVELENEAWKVKSEFDKFKLSILGVGGGENGMKIFKKMTKIFFEQYRFVFDKHMGTTWRASETLHYILGGDPYHARQFILWIVDYKARLCGEDVEVSSGDTLELPFVFPYQEVTLGKHHTMMHEDVKINLQDSMAYISAEADRAVILEDIFAVEHWDLIEELVDSIITVRLTDRSTWVGVNTSHYWMA